MSKPKDPITLAVGRITAALAPLTPDQGKAVLAAVNAIVTPPAPRRARTRKPAEPAQ